jgi:hypothetical protein
MTDTTQVEDPVFTTASVFSLATVATMAVIAVTAGRKLLPQNTPWQDRWTFIWLVCTILHESLVPDYGITVLILTAIDASGTRLDMTQ